MSTLCEPKQKRRRADAQSSFKFWGRISVICGPSFKRKKEYLKAGLRVSIVSADEKDWENLVVRLKETRVAQKTTTYSHNPLYGMWTCVSPHLAYVTLSRPNNCHRFLRAWKTILVPAPSNTWRSVTGRHYRPRLSTASRELYWCPRNKNWPDQTINERQTVFRDSAPTSHQLGESMILLVQHDVKVMARNMLVSTG